MYGAGEASFRLIVGGHASSSCAEVRVVVCSIKEVRDATAPGYRAEKSSHVCESFFCDNKLFPPFSCCGWGHLMPVKSTPGTTQPVPVWPKTGGMAGKQCKVTAFIEKNDDGMVNRSLKFTIPSFEPKPFSGYFKVDQEGIEPSSKRGNNMLSTCLSSLWFSCESKTEATHSHLEPLKTSSRLRGCSRLFPIWLHRCIKTLRKNCSWAMSRSDTSSVGIKLIYYASIKQRERSCFRQLNFREPSFKCPLSGALHAYIPLRPAVKSSLALKRYQVQM